MTLARVHDDATIDEAVAALAREPGGYFIAADAGLGSVPLEVRVTRRWRKADSNRWSPSRRGGLAPALTEIVSRPAGQLRKRRWDYWFESALLPR